MHDVVIAARRRSGESLCVRVRGPVVDRGSRQRGDVFARAADPDQLFSDVEQGRDVVRSEYGSGVIADFCVTRNLGETGARFRLTRACVPRSRR